jgi:hypothetical protein
MKILDVPQSGSVAGVTSSRNRFGQYRRTRAQPTNPSSSFQTAVRARLQLNADAWKALTAAQREGWGALGAQFSRTDSLGQTYDLTGFAAYCSINNNRLAAGDVVVADAPLFDIPAPLASVTPTATIATLSVAYTGTPLGAGIRAFISASPMRSAGRFYESDYRLINVTAAAAASPASVFTPYQARLGTPVVGAKIFVSVQLYKAGFLSTPITASLIVA